MNKKRYLISGKDGQLMTDIRKYLNRYENDIFSYSRTELDVTDYEKLKDFIYVLNPDYYIHGASVHVQNEIEKDSSYAYKVNVESLQKIADVCNDSNVTLINISTNYVFGNVFQFPLNEDDIPNPISMYGMLKRDSEFVAENYFNNYFTFRVAGLFGASGCRSKNDSNFIYMVLNRLANNEEIKVVNDQFMNIGYTANIAEMIIKFSQSFICNGIYHAINRGALTWFELAKFVALIKNKEELIKPTSYAEYYKNEKSFIRSPKFSVLNDNYICKDETINVLNWQAAVIKFMKEIGELHECW